MDKEVQSSFFLLLRLGLWGETNEDLSDFSLTRKQWHAVFNMSISQTVEALVYQGVLLLDKSSYPPYDILMRWTARVDAIERASKKMNGVLLELKGIFEASNIPFMLIKGQGLAANYKHPLQRSSGDIDLYFENKEDFSQAKMLLESAGIKTIKGDYNSIIYRYNDVEVEHHQRLIDIFNPFCASYVKQVIAEQQLFSQQLSLPEEQRITIPSFILSHIVISAHILKHYLGFGIGLRQLCDLAMLSSIMTKSSEADKRQAANDLSRIYKKLGINKWVNALNHILVTDLGLPVSCLPVPLTGEYKREALLKDILVSGNFGFYDVSGKKDAREEANTSANYKRNNPLKRVLPHTLKAIPLAPAEVFWFPLQKAISKILGG